MEITTHFLFPGGIIEECCHNPCTRSQLRQYCQKKQNHRTHPIKQQQHSDSSTTGPRDQLSLFFYHSIMFYAVVLNEYFCLNIGGNSAIIRKKEIGKQQRRNAIQLTMVDRLTTQGTIRKDLDGAAHVKTDLQIKTK